MPASEKTGFRAVKAIFHGEDCAIYRFPEGLEKFHRPARGIPYKDTFEEGTRFDMAKEVKGKNIPDIISNTLGWFMVSARLKTLLEAHATAPIEFLRFTLINHKKKPDPAELYVANVLGTVDCVDTEKTQGSQAGMPEGRYRVITQLAIHQEKIPKDVNIFRLQSLPTQIMLRDDLVGKFQEAGITGAEYQEPGKPTRLN